jgi:hypothetical protein
MVIGDGYGRLNRRHSHAAHLSRREPAQQRRTRIKQRGRLVLKKGLEQSTTARRGRLTGHGRKGSLRPAGAFSGKVETGFPCEKATMQKC